MTRRTILISLGALTVAAGAIRWAQTPHPSVLYRGHITQITGMAWSPDSKRVASSSANGTVQVWDAADGRHLLTYQAFEEAYGSEIVEGVAWSSDSQHIASASFDGTIQVWSASDGGHTLYQAGAEESPSTQLKAAWRVVWFPDGKRIASIADSGTVRVWNVANTYDVQVYRG